MIALLASIVLAQPAFDYLPPAEAIERALPNPWREVVSAPEVVTLEGLIPLTKRSRDVKVRWRRSLGREPESVAALKALFLDGSSYAIPGPGWGEFSLCGPQIPNLRLTFTRAKRVVIAEVCFGCGKLWLQFDEKGRRIRDESFGIAEDMWLEVFAPLVPEDDFVVWLKRRSDRVDREVELPLLDGGTP